MESRNDSFSFMLSSGAPPHPSAADLAVDQDREKNLGPLSPLGMILFQLLLDPLIEKCVSCFNNKVLHLKAGLGKESDQ
jgi:hypothetical protein